MIPSKAKVKSKAKVANLADSKADSKAHLESVYGVHRKLGHLSALDRFRDWNASPRTFSTVSSAPIASWAKVNANHRPPILANVLQRHWNDFIATFGVPHPCRHYFLTIVDDLLRYCDITIMRN